MTPIASTSYNGSGGGHGINSVIRGKPTGATTKVCGVSDPWLCPRVPGGAGASAAVDPVAQRARSLGKAATTIGVEATARNVWRGCAAWGVSEGGEGMKGYEIRASTICSYTPTPTTTSPRCTDHAHHRHRHPPCTPQPLYCFLPPPHRRPVQVPLHVEPSHDGVPE